MKKALRIWMVGAETFGRWMFFTAAILLVSLPVRALTRWLYAEFSAPAAVVAAVHVCVLFLVFPFVFYVMKQWMAGLPSLDANGPGPDRP